MLGNCIDDCMDEETEDMSCDDPIEETSQNSNDDHDNSDCQDNITQKRSEKVNLEIFKEKISKHLTLKELVMLMDTIEESHMQMLKNNDYNLVNTIAERIGENMEDMIQLQDDDEISEKAIEKAMSWMLLCAEFEWYISNKPSKQIVKSLVKKEDDTKMSKCLGDLDKEWVKKTI